MFTYAERVSPDVQLIGGPEHRPIEIVDYHPTWPRRFRRERDRITHGVLMRSVVV